MNKFCLLLLCSVALSACTSAPVLNQPLPQKQMLDTSATHLGNVAREQAQDDITVVLTLSGGGMRAAAFSYGVLQELDATRVTIEGKDHSLLSMVDVISSVSGGSFTAAYYGLYGRRIFSRYERRFLKRPIQSRLIKHWLLRPSSWLKMAPAFYNRSDLAADYYAREVFGWKKFRDFRKDSPHIVINATDLGAGATFSFTPENFRRICSDLGDYPVGKAVAASAAVPLLFSPIVLENYPGCKPFPHQNQFSHTEDSALAGVRRYQDKQRYPYLQLVDGGISDNLGVSSLLQLVAEQNNNFMETMKIHNRSHTRHVLFIVVNAADSIPPQLAMTPREPGTRATLSAITTIQSQRTNHGTLAQLRRNFPLWRQQVREARCGNNPPKACEDIRFHLAELNFQQLPPDQAQKLSTIETSLQLSDNNIDALILAGRQLLRDSPALKQALRSFRTR